MMPSGYALTMNSFLDACGISGPLQIALRSAGESGVRLLHQPFALIGRDQRSDVPLDHRLVSRRHVYVQVVEGQAFWIDLDSRSGTLDEGQPRKFGWLDAGRVIRVGPFELQRLMGNGSTQKGRQAPSGSAAISPLIARSHASQPLPEVALEFLNGPSRSACWPMNRVMSLIGSAAGCKFRLADPSVAPFHCSLLRSPPGLWVVDLLGPEGIGVNDASVRHALLADHDVLRVGRYRIRIHCRFPGREQIRDAVGDQRPVMPIAGESGRYPPEPIPTDILPNITEFPVPDLAGRAEVRTRGLSLFPSPSQTPLVDWASSASAELARLERGELTDPVLVPLVNQFGLMQQQLMDQFQQTISMLVQMFGSLHRDQMDLIREELDQLRDLTKEFQALKLELASISQGQRQVATAGTAAEPAGAAKPTMMPGPQERSPFPNVTAGAEGAREAPIPSRPRQASGTKSPPPSYGSSRERDHARTTENPPQGRAGEESQDADRDVIVWLHERMMTLQQERETRWQKILKMLPGLS
jgi:pSer/pThr/pTyr-binding forkhead associated (FHA) protein